MFNGKTRRRQPSLLLENIKNHFERCTLQMNLLKNKYRKKEEILTMGLEIEKAYLELQKEWPKFAKFLKQ